MRRNLGWLDLAASAPENVCVGHREAACHQVLINGRLMVEEQLFVGAVRHSHYVNVLEFGAGFAPIAMSQNMMTTNLAPRFHFTARRHRPMKERVESGDAHTASGWLYVL